MSAFVRASVLSLLKFPSWNARIEENYFVFPNYIDLAVAVGTKRGLVTPVLRNAHNMKFY